MLWTMLDVGVWLAASAISPSASETAATTVARTRIAKYLFRLDTFSLHERNTGIEGCLNMAAKRKLRPVRAVAYKELLIGVASASLDFIQPLVQS